MPVYPLPRRRPLDENATLAELQTIAGTADNIYGVYWATQQADPTGLIENWLDTYLYKASDQWYGNVRLVSYAVPHPDIGTNLTSLDVQLGEHIRLTGYALAAPEIAPGDILQVALQWQTTQTLADNYTVFAQILDVNNYLVGQRDAPPLIPGPNWPVNEPVADAHGIFIEPGTPPGQYRLIVGLYNSATGQRLPVEESGRDYIELVNINIVRPDKPLPRAAFNIQVPFDANLGNITLVGYDLYKVGHRSTPNTPLHPEDPVHLVLYWQTNPPLAETLPPLHVQVVTNSGTPMPVSFSMSLTDIFEGKKPSSGEIIRRQESFFLTGLTPGIYRLVVSGAESTQPVLTQPFRIE
jgi:hypothetical protein